MRTASLVLGIIGGSIGLLTAFLFFIGAVGTSDVDAGAGLAIVSGLVSLASIAGVIGGAIAGRHPVAAGVLQLLAAVFGLFAGIFVFYIIPAVLLIIGGVLALVDGSRARSETT